MYVTYNTTTGAISGWSSKSRTPPTGYAEIQCNDFTEGYTYYDASTDTFSGPTEAEQQATDLLSLRSERNALLSSCDWTQVPDSPLTDAKKAEWATYRQALRDLPSTTTDFANPVWPSQPS